MPSYMRRHGAVLTTRAPRPRCVRRPARYAAKLRPLLAAAEEARSSAGRTPRQAGPPVDDTSRAPPLRLRRDDGGAAEDAHDLAADGGRAAAREQTNGRAAAGGSPRGGGGRLELGDLELAAHDPAAAAISGEWCGTDRGNGHDAQEMAPTSGGDVPSGNGAARIGVGDRAFRLVDVKLEVDAGDAELEAAAAGPADGAADDDDDDPRSVDERVLALFDARDREPVRRLFAVYDVDQSGRIEARARPRGATAMRPYGWRFPRRCRDADSFRDAPPVRRASSRRTDDAFLVVGNRLRTRRVTDPPSQRLVFSRRVCDSLIVTPTGGRA